MLTDKQLAEVAFDGLLPYLKEKFANQEFESISQIVQRISGHENRQYEPRRNYQKWINDTGCGSDFESDGGEEIGLAEWVKNKKPISVPFAKKEPEKFGFDITKADKIFDMLLKEGLLKLSAYHRIPSEEELKTMVYCKFHNATSHNTNDCKVFRQQLQSAIEQGKIKFELPKKPTKPMKID